MTFDGKAFGAEIVGIVKGHVERSLAPLNARLDAFEKMIAALPVPKDGADGKSITLDDVAPIIKAEAERVGAGILEAAKASVAELVAAIPPAANGKDVDVYEVVALVTEKMAPDLTKMRSDLDALNPQIEAIGGAIGEEIAEHVGKALASIPVPLTVDETKALVADAVAALPPAENGKDADPVEVAALVAQEAERILAGWERPQDGKDGAQGEKGADGSNGKDGADGKDGRDGVDVKDLLVVEGGELVATFTDGRTKALGQFRGKDGTDGAKGKDGADGVGFEDIDLVETENGVVLRFTRGETVKDFRLPIVIDRGVFKEDAEYHKGDGVTWGGSFWIAQETSADKPDSGKGWRLAVKRGRDGKDGIMKPPTKPGPVKAG